MATAKKTPARGKKASTRKRTAAKKPPEQIEAAPDQAVEPTKYAVRNRTNVPFSFRLERQSETKRRTDLKPRGERGDFALLQDGDLDDPILQQQISLGAVEIITATEATKVAKKQLTNQQQVHPAMAMLRNELGEPYEEGAVTVAPSFEDQGVVVAELHDGQVAIDRRGIVRPGQEPQPDQRNRLRRPGGAPAASPTVTQSPDAVAAQVDAKARKKALQGPSAGLPDGITVTVEPTQQT